MQKDLTGQRFGRLIGESFIERRGKAFFWRFVCDCGRKTVAASHHVKAGRTSSCGCFRAETSAARERTHGFCRTPTYSAWATAKGRCHNPADKRFNYYGARGIVMCARWRDDFAAFLADMGEKPPERQLDRIDNDGPYSPDNCRWATIQQQMGNRRGCRQVEVAGERISLAEFARRHGVKPGSLYEHVRRTGRSAEDALRHMR